MVGNSKWGFTDLNASGRSLILWSVFSIADDNMQDQHCSCIASLIWRGTEDLRYVFLSYTVQDARTVRYLGLYVSIDSLTLTLASFSQRYLAKSQDNINVLLEQMKIVT